MLGKLFHPSEIPVATTIIDECQQFHKLQLNKKTFSWCSCEDQKICKSGRQHPVNDDPSVHGS